MPNLYTPREVAEMLGISYASVKWRISQGKIKSVQTAGGHHKIQESEIDRLLPRKVIEGTPEERDRVSRLVSGRNALFVRVTDIRVDGLTAQIRLSLGEQQITSIITVDALRQLRLKKDQLTIALITSLEVTIAQLV